MLDDYGRAVLDDQVITLIRLDARDDEGGGAPERVNRGWLRVLLLVVLPTLIAGVYFGAFAVDRYASEARFSIQQPGGGGRLPTASLAAVEATRGSGGGEEAYAIEDFIGSRDAIQLLLDKADLRAALARAARDPIWSFPGLLHSPSDESLFRYMRSMISASYDSSTNITILKVQAFTPADAQRIANVLLDASEDMVNRLNERSRVDSIRVAELDVTRARADALVAERDLTAFRDRNSVVDPTALSNTILKTISTLSLAMVEAAAQLDVELHSAPSSPQILPLQARIRAIQTQIDQERARLAGTDKSLAPQVAEYERLLLLRDFATKAFVSALGVLEVSQLDAERQHSYLARVVAPALPDEAAQPYRVGYTLLVFAVGLLLLRMFKPKRVS